MRSNSGSSGGRPGQGNPAGTTQGRDGAAHQRGRAGPFGALLAAAARDPAAARGLASAYGELDLVARRRIIEAIVADADAEGIAASHALLPLLAVEDDAEVAREIAAAIERENLDGIRGTSQPRAHLAGDETRGAAILVRPLHGDFVEVLTFIWTDRAITQCFFEPMLRADHVLEREVARLPEGLRYEDVPVPYAIDMVTPLLWAYGRTQGALPTGAERFADLFSILQHPA